MPATPHPISPAPWSTRPCNQGFYTITAADGHLVCKVPCDRMDRLTQAVADTRAIAALPLLLAALERYMGIRHPMGVFGEDKWTKAETERSFLALEEQARAALAAAKGGGK